ncbi:MAG: hypothetical protein RSB99_01905 [Bacilli bacterium]
MVNREHNLTIDDLIVEYIIFKVQNGYEPKFLASEFMKFLYFFESRMQVQHVSYEKEKLFQGFFERKAKFDWVTKKHLDIDKKDDDYIIRANYNLSDYDKSIINTYFMDNGMSKFADFIGTAAKIRNIIGEYLSSQPKRKIDKTIKIDEKDLLISEYLSAEIIGQIWHSYIDKQVECRMWPKQCDDISKYLLQVDLADIIGVPSIKNELLELYSVLSERIAILYHQDKNLKVSSCHGSYLAKANYELLIPGYEKIMGVAFGPEKKSLRFNLALSTLKDGNTIDDVDYWNDTLDIDTSTAATESAKAKELVKSLATMRQKN